MLDLRRMRPIVLAIFVLLIARVALAQEETPAATPAPTVPPTPAPTPPAWTGSLELGATATSGNTSLETYTTAFKTDGRWRGWGVAARAIGLYAENRNVQTAGAYETSLRGDRKIWKKLDAYVRLSADGDPFKGFHTRQGIGSGLGAEVWKRTEGKLVKDLLRIEAGYQFLREDLVRVEEDRDIHAGRGFLGYKHAFDQTSAFSQEIEAVDDLQGRTIGTSITSLTVQLRKNLALKIAETIKFDTRPPLLDPADPTLGRFEEIDTLTAGAVIVSF